MEFRRHNFRWNINEILRLQREFELLGFTIQEISNLHERSTKAILYKLEKEGFIKSWSVVKGIEEYIENDENLREHKSLILDGCTNHEDEDDASSSLSSSNHNENECVSDSSESFNTPHNNYVSTEKKELVGGEKRRVTLLDYFTYLHINMDMLFLVVMCYIQNLFKIDDN